MDVTLHTLSPSEPMPAPMRELWQALRNETPGAASPYFHPDYAQAVARASPDPVRVAVQGRQALFAFQGKQAARPVGAPMTDYQGVLGKPDEHFLALAGIKTLQVNGWTGAASTQHESLLHEPVCRIDLADGWQAWRNSRDGSYTRHAKGHRRRVRRATEDIGEPRASFCVADTAQLDTLIAWKRAQFATTGKYDVLRGWPQELLRDLHAREQGYDLRVDLHALHFGDRPAAFDLGLSDGTTFHSWIVAYDPELSTYGPGIQLLETLVEAAPSLGYSTLDLGQGMDGYKRHYANVDAHIGSGVIRTNGALAGASRAWGTAEARLPALGRFRRRYGQIAACEPTLAGRVLALTSAMTDAVRS